MKNQINADVEEKLHSKDTSQKPESHILSQRSQEKGLSHSEQQNQQCNETSENELNLQRSSKQRCQYIRLTQFMNSTKLQLVCMIMIPELFFIIISILLVQKNLQYTSDSVSNFSQNLFQQSADFVKKQAFAVQMSLELQLQTEAVMLNAMHSLQFQAIRGEILFQSGFKKPVLNVDRTYLNQGDPYLLQQFKKNFTLFISSWHQKNAIREDQLDSFSLSQLEITPKINFLLRSVLYANQADPSLKNKLLIQQYSFPFGSDGMLIFTKGANYSYASFVDQPPCTAGAYKLDTRCRPYFYTTKYTDIVTAFPPTVLQSGASASSYHVSSGFCKRQPLPLSLLDKFQVNSLNNGIYSLVCNSIQLEQIQFLFDRFSSDPRVLIMLLDPVSMKLVYNSDTSKEQAKLITFEAAYLKNLDSQSNRDYFLLMVKQYAEQKMKSICYEQGQDYHQIAEDYSFNFTQEGKETMVFINHISSFDLSQMHTDDVYGENSPITLDSGLHDYQPNQKRKMCVSSFWIFLIVIPKDQLMQQAYALEQQMDTINIIFQVMIYIGLGISAFLFFIYLKQISYMMDAPIQRLTSILKEMNVCEATVAYNHLSEKESEDLFFSSDARVLFESFRKLFVTLVFATQSMLGDKQCETLLNLNKQILHFKQLKNYRALGICSNNIGNIHHNNSRYIEALENYQMAILYAQYELQLYKEQTAHKEVKYPSLSNTYHQVSSFFKKLPPFQDLFEKNISANITKEPQKYPDFQSNENSQEIYWVLYNRKFNFLKSLIGLMGSQESSFTDWPTAKILADDLQTISDTKLLPNEKRKIILNHVELYIHCHTGALDTYMKLLNENKTIINSPGFSKPAMQHSSKTRKDKFRKSNINSPAGTPNDKGSQSGLPKKEKSIHLNQSDRSDSSIDASYNHEKEEQYGDISSTNQHNYMPYEDDYIIQMDKNDHVSEEEIKERKQSYHCLEIENRFDWKQPTEDDAVKEKGTCQKHVTLEDNLLVSRSQLNSSNLTPYSEINNQTIEKFHESGQNLIEFSSSKQLKLDENKSLLLLRRNPQKTHILKHFAATTKISNESNHQLNKNPSYDSFNQRNERIDSNLHRHSMKFRSFHKNSNGSEFRGEHSQGKDKVAIRKSSKSMKQSDISQSYFKPKVNSKWLTNSQVDISRSLAFAGKIKSKQVNEKDDYPCSSAPNNTTHRTTITTATKQEINQLSQGQFVNYDNNPYMQENALFLGIVSWEEATVLLLKNQLFNSASEFTLFFEDTYNALPIMQYQAFDMLAFILSSARLRDNTLEQMASIYEFDTSFRIQVLVFESTGINIRNYEATKDLLGENRENQNQEQQEQDQYSRQTLIKAGNFEDPKDELYYLSQKYSQQLAGAAERICLEITQKVMRKPDDMIGIAVASSPWQIESKMEMVQFKLLNRNAELFALIAHNLVLIKNQKQPIEIEKEKISIDEHIVRLNSSDTIHNSIQLNSLLLTSSVPENKQELFQQTLTTSHTPQEGQDRLRILERQAGQERDENKTKKEILNVPPLLLQLTGQMVQREQLQQHHPLHPRLQQKHYNSTVQPIEMQEKGNTELNGFKSIEQLSDQLLNRAEPVICNSKLIVEKPQNEVKQIECHEAMIINPDQFSLATEEGDEEKKETVNKQFEKPQKQHGNYSDNKSTERQKHIENILSSEGIPFQGIQSTVKTQGDYQENIVPLRNYSKYEQNEIQQILNFQQKTEKCSNSPQQNIKNDIGYSKQSISKKTAELRVLFIMAARKSLQSVLLHEGGQPNQIYFQVKLAETRATFIDELDLLQEKRHLNYFELHKKQDRQISKKFSIIITNQLYFISPKDQALVTLYRQSRRFSVPLFILCLSEEEAIQFQRGIPTEYSEIVLVFTSEKNLIDHLFSERAPMNFNFFPLSVEHF